ncbi:unnamed protein product (macronuclear) [Paramecium tetraurelia]|uniref:HSF-type DNA-binding domain-containing protein n=1 Tax=Paramecium tetraurelia TaxID=5888 RepID=A0CEL7_PARTE|nr:uncharacterized protein GSPATT00037672001 [Paramecium tetraurelia]CAK69234.1 unnamed protein product [Paramecium tetraurelia]|eukprot:XP_001436631.1 hypothetical protein (macronuclear) [Paramecium tetraurelia strain d4-2]
MLKKNAKHKGIKFIEVTYEMLKQNKNRDIIRWDEDGVKIQILDRELLQELVLPQHFKHANYASFLRQLNLYGFISSKDEQGAITYYHPSFAKQQVLMRNIFKKKNKKEKQNDFNCCSFEENELPNQMKALQCEQVKIQQKLFSSIQYQIKIKNSMKLFLQTQHSLAQEGENLCKQFIENLIYLVKGMKQESKIGFDLILQQQFPQSIQEDPQSTQVISEIADQSNQYLFSPTPLGRMEFDQEQITSYQNSLQLMGQFSEFGFEL